MQKKIFTSLTALAVVLVLTLSCTKSKKTEGYTFKIGIQTNTYLCSAPLYLAVEKGYFDDEGLQWERSNVGDGETLNLLTSGQIDGTNTLIPALIQPLANGLPVKAPLALHSGCLKVLVRADSPIKSVADLKGKKIGTAGPAASPTIIAKRYIMHEGLKADGENADVEFIYQSGAELPMLLEKGIVDAIGMSDPSAQVLENAGKARAVINTAKDDYLKDEFCCAVVVRSDVVRDYPEDAAKFIRAVQKAALFVHNNPREVAQLLAEKNWVPGEASVNAETLQSFNYRASVSEALPALLNNARDMQKIGMVASDVDVDALVQNTFVKLEGVPDHLE